MTQECTSAGTQRSNMHKPLLPLPSPGVVHGLHPQSCCPLVKLASLYSLIRTHVGASETSCPNKPSRAALGSSPDLLACILPDWMTSASRATVAVLALLMLCLASRPAEAGLWRQQREQPSFNAVPARIAAKGQGKASLPSYVLSPSSRRCCSALTVLNLVSNVSLPCTVGSLTELQAQAAGETFVNKLLGTDCFTKSLSIVSKDCSNSDSEKKNRLAMALAICHLDQLGLPAFTCKPSMTLKQCADNMKDDRQYTTYMEFLSNVDTYELFLLSIMQNLPECSHPQSKNLVYAVTPAYCGRDLYVTNQI